MMKNEHTKIFFNKFHFPQFKGVECEIFHYLKSLIYVVIKEKNINLFAYSKDSYLSASIKTDARNLVLKLIYSVTLGISEYYKAYRYGIFF